MSSRWESTLLLRVTDEAYVRAEPLDDGCETQKLIECPRCHRSTDWLIAAAGSRVEFACRCGHRWQVSTELPGVVAMAEYQPIAPHWRSLDDVQRALGFYDGGTEPPRWDAGAPQPETDDKTRDTRLDRSPGRGRKAVRKVVLRRS